MDGTNVVYRTSTDGSSWSSSTTLFSQQDFSTCFDGTYVHYARCDGGYGSAMYYRRGTPNSDGTITWSAAEQTAFSESNLKYTDMSIAVDSSGYPWIAYVKYDNSAHDWNEAKKSSKNDGTWVTQDSATFSSYCVYDVWKCSIVALTGQKMYLLRFLDSGASAGYLWDGSSWGGSESIGMGTDGYPRLHSAIADGDNVHVVAVNWASEIIYNKRTYGSGWGTAVTVQSSVTFSTGPVLSLNSDNGDLYCFWAGSPTANHIYYKKRNGSTGNWDSSPTDWIDETTNGLTASDRLTGFYKSYGGKIGLAYMTKTSSPFNVRFDKLRMATDYDWASTTSSVTVATVVDITLSNVPIAWGTKAPGTENNLANTNAGNPATVTVESTTNVNVDIYIKGTNWSDGAGHTITVDKCHYDNDNVAGGTKWTALTTSYATGPNQGFFEDVAPDTAKNTYWFIDIPVGQWAANYSNTIYFKAVRDGTTP